MEGDVLKMELIHKINGSAKMKVSAETPATAHTFDRSDAIASLLRPNGRRCPMFSLSLRDYVEHWLKAIALMLNLRLAAGYYL